MVTINGKMFPGNFVEVVDGIAYIDGKAVDVDLQGGLDLSMESEGKEQNLNLDLAANDGSAVEIHQKSTTGDNIISLSF